MKRIHSPLNILNKNQVILAYFDDERYFSEVFGMVRKERIKLQFYVILLHIFNKNI
jgi:hypothetical protein